MLHGGLHWLSHPPLFPQFICGELSACFRLQNRLERCQLLMQVVAVTAARLGAPAAATEARMRKLAGQPQPGDSRDKGEAGPGEALAKLFCRRCRIFNCMTHPGEHAPWWVDLRM